MARARAMVPVLDQRQRDVLGLALVAVGVFLGFVIYGGWDGGRVGHGVAVGLGWALGGARLLAPVALVAGGRLCCCVRSCRRSARCGPARSACSPALRSRWPPARSVSPPAPAPGTAPGARHLQAHGGLVGQALYEARDRLVQSVGVEILVVFLLIAGRDPADGRLARGRPARDRRRPLPTRTRIVRGLAEREQAPARASGRAIRPRSPTGELIVRATHVEAPSRDWQDEDEPAEPEPLEIDDHQEISPEEPDAR